MRLIFFTHYFPPESNAPASRTYEHCRRWVEQGHEVTVITCAPNVPNGVVYEGYRNRLWPQRETMDGIEVLREKSLINPRAQAAPMDDGKAWSRAIREGAPEPEPTPA